MYHIIYETINLINQKKYIGMHVTENLQDKYLGSGKSLKYAINKYGRQNFKRNILFIFDNEQDMRNKEEELVTEEIIKDKNYYNMVLGGKGYAAGNKHPYYGNGGYWLGKKQSKEHIKNALNARKGYKHSLETRNKIKQGNLGTTRPSGKDAYWFGKFHNTLTKEKMAEIKAKLWKIITPSGSVEIVKNLNKYCKEYSLSPKCMFRILNGTQRQHKKYKIEKV